MKILLAHFELIAFAISVCNVPVCVCVCICLCCAYLIYVSRLIRDRHASVNKNNSFIDVYIICLYTNEYINTLYSTLLLCLIIYLYSKTQKTQFALVLYQQIFFFGVCFFYMTRNHKLVSFFVSFRQFIYYKNLHEPHESYDLVARKILKNSFEFIHYFLKTHCVCKYVRALSERERDDLQQTN